MKALNHGSVLVFLALFLLGTLLFWVTKLDLWSIRFFYDPATGFSGKGNPIFDFFYFPLNAIILSVSVVMSLFVLGVSFFRHPPLRQFATLRSEAVYLFTTTLVGAGFINGFLLKAIFGRPRPFSVLTEEAVYYPPFYIVRESLGDVSMSFPSGHVSVAVSLCAFYFLFRNANGRLRLIKWGIGVILPVVLGIIMMMSRMAYGDHFLSDGVFAALFTVLWAALLAKAFKPDLPMMCVFEKRLDKKAVLVMVVIGHVVLLLTVLLMVQTDGLTKIGS